MRPRLGRRSVDENSDVVLIGCAKAGTGITSTLGAAGTGAARGHGTADNGHGTVDWKGVDTQGSLTFGNDDITGGIRGSCLRGVAMLAKGFGTP